MWHKVLSNWNGVSMFYDSGFTNACDMELYTDSSLIGFGGVFQNQWFCSEWPMDLPTIKESDLLVAFRELYPIVAAALIWGKQWTSKRILFRSDNMATVFIVQRGGSKSIPIMKLMQTLTWTAAVNNFHFSARHVPGVFNRTSDALSRLMFQKFRECEPTADPSPQPCPTPAQILWE